MTTTETFLLALSLILGLPWLIWRVGRTDTYVPLVVIQIGLGVVMGRAYSVPSPRRCMLRFPRSQSWPLSMASPGGQ